PRSVAATMWVAGGGIVRVRARAGIDERLRNGSVVSSLIRGACVGKALRGARRGGAAADTRLQPGPSGGRAGPGRVGIHHRSMSSFDRVPVRPSRVGRRDATRIVALRHVGRTARRTTRGGRVFSILAGALAIATVSLGLIAIVGIIAVSATIGVLSVGL